MHHRKTGIIEEDTFQAVDKKSLVKQWQRFKESIKIEEHQRNKFEKSFEEKKHNILPLEVSKFISTIKHSVRSSMRVKGGTAFSILRQMFLYWDRDRTGRINERDLLNCMSSLGVRIKPEEARAVIKYYQSKYASPAAPSGSISYEDLLNDVQNGEPGLLEFTPDDKFEEPKSRFEFEVEKYAVKPPLVQKFIQAIRFFIMKRILRDGGTPFSIVRQIFMFYDINLSSALNSRELTMAMRKGMGLVFSDKHCAEILRFYNRDGSGEFGYQILLKDIVENFPSMLDFSGTESFFDMKGSDINPFLPKDFELKDNKTIEMLKVKLSSALIKQLAARGGSYKSLLLDAFAFWDPRCIGKLNNPNHIVGAMKRVGVDVTADELRLLLKRYDKDRDGEMNYGLFVDEMARDEKNFLADPPARVTAATTSHSNQSPAGVSMSSAIIKNKVNGFNTKTGGKLIPKDILHGTFLRYDSLKAGRIGLQDLKLVCQDLHIQLSDTKLQALLSWFDSNGSNKIDYNAFINEIYGEESGVRSVGSKTESVSDSISLNDSTLALKNVSYGKKIAKLKVDDERRLARLAQMRQEKSLIKKKLASVDSQRRELEEQYRNR